MSEAAVLGRSQRRDRAILLLGLAALAALLWTATVFLASGMHPGHAGVAPLVGMWVLMMAAMMVPVAAPCLLDVAGTEREDRETPRAVVVAGLFLSGDLLVWTGFSLFAALAQWRLHAAALMTPTPASMNPALGGVLLVMVGLFQLTPIKKVCLMRCRALTRSEADTVRARPRRAFLLGLEHGVFSAGSCGALMLVLFATGVMSIPWMAALTGLLVLERIAPQGLLISRTSGVFFATWGGWMLVASLV